MKHLLVYEELHLIRIATYCAYVPNPKPVPKTPHPPVLKRVTFLPTFSTTPDPVTQVLVFLV